MAAPGAAGGASPAEKLRVQVLSPEATVYQGEATHVLAPAANGYLGILRGHAPLMAILGDGVLRVDDGRDQKRFNVSGGFLQVVDDVVTVLSEKATVA